MLGIGWEEPEHLFPEQMGDATVSEFVTYLTGNGKV